MESQSMKSLLNIELSDSYIIFKSFWVKTDTYLNKKHRIWLFEKDFKIVDCVFIAVSDSILKILVTKTLTEERVTFLANQLKQKLT